MLPIFAPKFDPRDCCFLLSVDLRFILLNHCQNLTACRLLPAIWLRPQFFPPTQWKGALIDRLIKSPHIIEKETVDEIIFRTDNVRNRLILELMARGGMRVGEVLKLTSADIVDRKLILNDTKSGKEQELIFIPQKIADRLKEYIRVQKIAPKQMIFPICYGAARAMVGKAGKLVGIKLRPHDLRRHAATFASRSNVPLEIISKVILRHSSLKTTEIYLGKVSDNEAIRWIENLYA